MRIYLKEIKQSQGEAVHYQYSGLVPDTYDLAGSGDDSSFTVELDARLSGDQIIVSGILALSYQVECSRCLCLTRIDCKTDFHEGFTLLTGVAENEDPELLAAETANALTVTGDYLYLDEYLRQLFLLAQDLKPLCSPGCKGICAQCGTDLNRAKCTCQADPEIDLRLIKLKELTSDS